MKYYLFVDNFRGFSDTTIPVTGVNFLVGENSTGKSSILNLVKLLSGPRFLMGQDIGHESQSFGHFLDMVSAHSDDQTHFHIGFAADVAGRKREDRVAAGCLFTFRERQGQPQISKCTFQRGSEQVSLKFGNAVHYKARTCQESSSAGEVITNMRTTWAKEHAGKEEGYEKLDIPRGVFGRIPILIALSMASDISQKGRKRKEFTLYPPDAGFAPPDLTWFGPIRTEPKRTYDELSLEFSPEGQHTPYLIRKMLNSKSQAIRLKEFIERVGQASGLFQSVQIKSFGRGVAARFELDVVLDGKALNILNVGYGVSQSLPIIVEILARDPGTWFALQEPEIHLHPRAQAALGDVLFEMAALENKCFLVETHSDYTIDRFRTNYKNGRANKPDSQILFFERRDKHNVITPLPISKKGELPTDQPETYRRFFIREQISVLGI